MTKFLQDIYNQPEQLAISLEYTVTKGKKELYRAASLVRQSTTIFISAIGASFNAGLALQASFNEAGIIAVLCDAADFLHFTKIPPRSTVLFLSRSGRSIEIVNAISKCKLANAAIISITNADDTLLAGSSDCCLLTYVKYDNSISVSTYSSIVLTCQLLALTVQKLPDYDDLLQWLTNSFKKVADKIPLWDKALDASNWIDNNQAFYFMARGKNFSSACEARLLWEEAAKQPASALTTGSFRHGPQEIVNDKINIGIWLDDITRNNDIRLINDLNKHNANTLTLGINLPADLRGHQVDMPALPEFFYPVVNIIPMQLAAEKLAIIKGENPDTFKFCNFIVESEGGL